jgi:hypothetical protein
MANVCHLNWGKYTLFCCYGVTGNENVSSSGFAIIFGNKNGASWRQFWNYVVQLHPSIYSGNILPLSWTRIRVKRQLSVIIKILLVISIGHGIGNKTSSKCKAVLVVKYRTGHCGYTTSWPSANQLFL